MFLLTHPLATLQPSCHLLRRAADGQNDAVMGVACRQVILTQSFEIRTIMGQQSTMAVHGVGQRVGIVVMDLAGFLGRRGHKPASPYPICD